MNPTPEQLRLCAYLMENPEVPWQWKSQNGEWVDHGTWDVWGALIGHEIQIKSYLISPNNPKYSREGKTLLILHNQDCDQFGDITGESPSHLWFTRHGGYFKMEKATGEVETLKPAEF